MKNLIEIQEKLKEILKRKRFEHTLGVRYTAAALAMCHGCDVYQAELAGLLHDCAKGYTEQELLEISSQRGIVVSVAEEKAPHLLHAKVGAYLAEHIYGVEDQDVLEAIRFHTTGKPSMTKLEKIIFIADYIEPNRKMLEALPEVRKMAFQNLDKTMFQILENTLRYLKETNGADGIDDTTYCAYEYYKSKISG